jgi:DNA-binding LacI/PurR family transcriptional regulator
MAGKTSDLVLQLRQEIVDGRYAPGERIPSQLELADRFDVAGMTVQMVVKHLEREGFVEARGPLGTFVAETPPHLNQYALVFPFDPGEPHGHITWSRYYQALTQAAIRFQAQTGRRMMMFHGIDWHTDSEDRRRLITYMEAHRVAGVIFSNGIGSWMENTPILDLPGIPRVVIGAAQQFAHIPVVKFDSAMWIDKALDHLAALGRRRVALIEYGQSDEFYARFQAGLAARGMVSHRRWRQFANIFVPSCASLEVELLMNDRERPDALLIEDDNFVEQALAGLTAAGVSDVAVIGHANFPVAPVKVQPMRLLGYDACRTLRACVDLIDRQRAGEQVSGETMAPALWEEEVAAKPPVVRGQKLEVSGQNGTGASRLQKRIEMPEGFGAGTPPSRKSAGRKRKMEMAGS